jgi:hypothetical protein
VLTTVGLSAGWGDEGVDEGCRRIGRAQASTQMRAPKAVRRPSRPKKERLSTRFASLRASASESGSRLSWCTMPRVSRSAGRARELRGGSRASPGR